MSRNFYSILLASFFLLIVAGEWSCVSDTDLAGLPEVSFKTDVQPIIVSNCTQEGCHGIVQPEQSALLTYADIRAGVKPGDGRHSDIYERITDRNEEIMPPAPASHLSDKQISTIFIWIEQGAKDN